MINPPINPNLGDVMETMSIATAPIREYQPSLKRDGLERTMESCRRFVKMLGDLYPTDRFLVVGDHEDLCVGVEYDPERQESIDRAFWLYHNAPTHWGDL